MVQIIKFFIQKTLSKWSLHNEKDSGLFKVIKEENSDKYKIEHPEKPDDIINSKEFKTDEV